MPRFFVCKEQIKEKIITIKGDDAHHISRSLRMAIGQSITVCDMQGNEYFCDISGFDGDKLVFAEIKTQHKSSAEPRCKIRLFQALPKGDKLDSVIQKAVECGASEIIPFESERCVARVKPEAEDRKTERRNKIAEEAAKQCGRSILPTVAQTVSFDGMLELAVQSSVCFFCYEGEGTEPLGRVIRQRLVADETGEYPDVSVIIGSEGGFSTSEAQRAIDAGMCAVGLGKRILRTETAPVFALSCIVFFTELFD